MSYWRQIWLLTGLAAAGVLLLAQASDAANGVPTPQPRPGTKAAPKTATPPAATKPAMTPAAAKSTPAPAPAKSTAAPPARKMTAAVPLAFASTTSTSSADLAAVKEAIAAARARRADQAAGIQRTISDPLARKLVEWAILRSDDNEVEFSRYVAFIAENPMWPSIGMMRRRAEASLWQERLDPATVQGYFGKNRPLSAKGKFALARALLLQGDRAGAASLVRDAWRNDNFSGELEGQALDVFSDLITNADHKARMDIRLYAEDADGGLRAAEPRWGACASHRQGARRGDQEGGQRQGTARRSAGRGAPRCRLYLQPHPVPAPRGQGQGSDRADAVGAARSRPGGRRRPVVDRAAAGCPQTAR